ncbi:unnamed protein product [Notodromas monacha]|uniref:C2H2-type domain-containing protein n=1 Tax=Notodromas monacha TaxID=399045 RepID=A0A7R9G9Q5_9CRUS|nr:unnamed protein product [Notodromas monacha]CAG0914512.1 unnamed protein product [Notodromas monacha]
MPIASQSSVGCVYQSNLSSTFSTCSFKCREIVSAASRDSKNVCEIGMAPDVEIIELDNDKPSTSGTKRRSTREVETVELEESDYSALGMRRPKRMAAIAATIPISQIFREDEDQSKPRILKQLRDSHPNAVPHSDKSILNSSCFLCRTPAENCMFVSNLGECMTRVTRLKLCDKLKEISSEDLTAHEIIMRADMEVEILCVACENLVQEVDSLEVKLAAAKSSVNTLITNSVTESAVRTSPFLNISRSDYGVFLEGIALGGLSSSGSGNVNELLVKEEIKRTEEAFDGSTFVEKCMSILGKFTELENALNSSVNERTSPSEGKFEEMMPIPNRESFEHLDEKVIKKECLQESTDFKESNFSSNARCSTHKAWPSRRSQIKNIEPEENELSPEGVQRSPDQICRVCGRYFETVKDRLSHERDHDEPPPYICPFCADVHRERIKLKDHVRTVHLAKNPFICTHCGDTFVIKSKLDAHLASLAKIVGRSVLAHESPATFKCDECGKQYRRKRSLNQHKLSHSGFACKACPCVFLDKKAFFEHVWQVHADEEAAKALMKTKVRLSETMPSSQKTVTAEIFATPAVSKEELKLALYSCPYCNVACADTDAFASHMESEHQDMCKNKQEGTPAKKRRKANKTGWPPARVTRLSEQSSSSAEHPEVRDSSVYDFKI